MVQDGTKVTYYDGLIGSHICTFDWYQNQWPWITLNGWNALMHKEIVLQSPPEKKLNDERQDTIRGKMYVNDS